MSETSDDSPQRRPVDACQDADSETMLVPALVGARVLTSNHVPSELPRIGGYEILGEIARGGMGVVYKARQSGVNRIVAIKQMLAGDFAVDADRRRFLAEAESAGQLDHPNIVPVYDVGENEGNPFFSMGFIDGPSLVRYVENGLPTPRRSAEIMCSIADGVEYAHSHGIIHRDLKPHNVLIDPNGSAKITDFGLARRISEEKGLTTTGQILGTPGYMPPEQASGNLKEIGPASDVYGLGATLYFLLTARAPFHTSSLMQTIRQVLEQLPVPPRLLNSDVPKDLQTICLKCLEKKPSDRYPSAAAVAADLRRFLASESIQASSPNLMDHVVRQLLRNQDDFALRQWSSILWKFAVIVFARELLMTTLFQIGVAQENAIALGYGTGVLQLMLLAWVLRSHRRDLTGALQTAGRLMISIWISFVAGCFLTAAILQITSTYQPVSTTSLANSGYPYFAVLSGMVFFISGSSYWGRCYLMGIAFFSLSLVLPYCQLWTPTLFGGCWAVCLLTISWRLRRLAAQEEREAS